MSSTELLSEVLKLSGGQIVGRIRLQKTFFLLKEAGLDSDFEFEYHHYGPYSEELSSSLGWAEAEGALSEEFKYRADGVRYSVFKLNNDDTPEPTSIGNMPTPKVKEMIAEFSKVSATVLELAATALWLKQHEQIEDWRSELGRRKASKITDERVEKAVALLKSCEFAM